MSTEIDQRTLMPYAQGKSNGITVDEAMPTEIDELKKRVASLEKEFRAVFGKAETIDPAPGAESVKSTAALHKKGGARGTQQASHGTAPTLPANRITTACPTTKAALS